VATILLAAASLAAVSGAHPSSAQEVSACAVLTPSDINATLGVPVNGAGRAVNISPRHSCEWKYGSGANQRLAVFTSPKAETLDTSIYISGPKGVAASERSRREGWIPRVPLCGADDG
jgi:hypothetical protein